MQHLPLRIIPVQDRRMLRRFIRLPWSIYAADPAWVPPLRLERRNHLSPRNPYFAHADWQAWLALRGDRAVGRISAQIDRLYREHHDESTGFFGLLEAEDDQETFAALFAAAEHWLQAQGMRRALGPFNLSVNDECGLLVEGFETSPMVMMGHARPYYGPRVEAQGYSKAKDLLAYLIDLDFALPEAIRRWRMPRDLRIRPLRRARLDQELELLREIFNDAWSQNWGFVPFTEAEFTRLGRDLARLVNDDYVQIAEVGGEPAAMMVGLPNLNEAIRDLNGRLAPFGWLKLLWRLKVRHPATGRIPLMGVRKRYQRSLLGAALAFLLMDAVRVAGRKRGVEQAELSWILEDNMPMRNILEAIGGRAYKRYRLYGKDLT